MRGLRYAAPSSRSEAGLTDAGPGRAARTPRPPSPPSGQASIELVGLLPLVVALGLGVMQVLSAGAAHEAADAAAEAGAVALLQDADPRDAARDALPGWARGRAEITVRGRRVRVSIRPRGPLPVLTGMLVATAAADAGPRPGSGR